MLELEIPIPPSVNSYWRAIPNKTKGGGVRGARNILSAAAREYRTTVLRQLAPLGLKPLTGRLALVMEVCAHTRRAFDLDNILKGSWDALTYAGVWQDDEQIDRYTVIRGTPGAGVIRVTVQEIPKHDT